ncbi:VWA domain-containing protein [Lentzea aerocolonigenes]|uniref:VWA domain-containing protein n=1 Tax=Lentzea aerocolonigenes TaxID=68170 RepID=UPI00068FBCFD|nr:vWA domain-containing protein [Lentzea aerocolonigenes]MCP2242594.1 von Willebrand factor type A domain-containing protein [Lentzea aerocolonigenes]
MRLSVLASTAAALLLSTSSPTGAAPQQQQPEPVITPANIVVLVDESSSISSQDVDRERDAAALIALGEFAPSSTIAVVGFGSDNGGQSPVDVVCPPSTVATAQDRQRLSDCTRGLKSRKAGEGEGTDHAAALQQALSYLEGDKSGPKLIFLLTDGKLDVSDSPRYGPDNVGDQRNRTASELIGTLLQQANREKTQIWPLGFGNVDQAQLDRFAKGSFQGQCGVKSPTPAATVVSSSADVAQALIKAFQAARCAGASDIQRTPVSSGGTAEAKVTIPVIATDGSILVTKHDSRIAVSYVDPEGKTVPKSGTQGDSTFQVSGENGTVEGLRIVNPLPGEWTVKITSAPGVPPLDVSTVVMYQGAVRSSMTVNPPAPQAGQEVTVALSLHTRSRSITDPSALKDLSFTADVRGEGFTTLIPLNDDAQNGDSRDQDGVYSGKIVIPGGAKGAVKFTGTVAGIGISSDTRIVDAALVTGPRPLVATTTFGNTDWNVAPGDTVRGTVTVTNNSGRARKARIVVADAAPGTVASIPGEQTVLDVPPSGTSTFDFDLAFADDTVKGANAVTLRVVDDENPDDVIYEWRLTATVEEPPPLTQIAIGITIAAVVTTALVLFLHRRRRRDVRGLVVHLYDGHRSRGDLAAPEQPSSVFRFHLGEAAAGVPHLAHSAGGEDSYELSRVGGRLQLRTPFGDTQSLHLGERVDVSPSLSIEVEDEHSPVGFSEEHHQDPFTAAEPQQRPSDNHLL